MSVRRGNDIIAGNPAVLWDIKENNPFFFGESHYFPVDPQNGSWLVSNGQYNSGAVYLDFWRQLNLVELDPTLNVGDSKQIAGKTYIKRGLSVKLDSETYTDYDFVVNQGTTLFRLPLLNGEEDLPSDTKIENPFTKTVVSGESFTAPYNGFLYLEMGSSGLRVIRNGFQQIFVGTANGTSAGETIFLRKGDVCIIYPWNDGGVAPVLTQSWFIKANNSGVLCYYVGDIVIDSGLIDAAAVLNVLSNKISFDDLRTCHTCIETYTNGASWYRLYDDKWIIQGGTSTISALGTTIYFLKSYANTNYSLALAGSDTSGDPSIVSFAYRSKAAGSFVMDCGYNGTFYASNFSWIACGYEA